MSPADTFASKARRSLHAETVTLRDRALNKGIAAGQVRQTQQGGRRGGGRRKKGGGAPTNPKE